MSQDEIIEMVMQISGCDKPKYDSPALKIFVAFAKQVTEHEREACAKLIESHGQTLANGLMLTEAIRARGQA